MTDHLFLPEKEELDKLLRYEAMIHRQLNHAMAELEKVQARSKGEAHPPRFSFIAKQSQEVLQFQQDEEAPGRTAIAREPRCGAQDPREARRVGYRPWPMARLLHARKLRVPGRAPRRRWRGRGSRAGRSSLYSAEALAEPKRSA